MFKLRCVGIDVAQVDVAIEAGTGVKRYANDVAGHTALVAALAEQAVH